jgi:hypothetical protein
MVIPIPLLFQNHHKRADFLPLSFFCLYDLFRKKYYDALGSNLLDIQPTYRKSPDVPPRDPMDSLIVGLYDGSAGIGQF